MPIQTYAVLARETYHLDEQNLKHELPPSWSIAKIDITNDVWGNSYAVFMNNESKEIVLAVRGTANVVNIITDIGLALSRLGDDKFIPPGQEELDAVAHKILTSDKVCNQNYNFKIIGYSLGAIMAELSAVKLGIECITFESPGSLDIMKQYPAEKYPEKNYHLITTYLGAPNAINTLNAHAGSIFRMYLPHHKAFNVQYTMGCLSNTLIGNYVYKVSSNVIAYIPFLNNRVSNAVAKQLDPRGLFSAIGLKLGFTPLIWYEDIAWLVEQHSIVNIERYLLNSGEVSKMDSWPTTVLITVPEAIKETKILGFSSYFSPLQSLQKNKPGIRDIFDKDETKEAQINRIPGYVENKFSTASSRPS